MKISHFASAAASVLVLSMATSAFAQTGYVSGTVGTNRYHAALQQNTTYSLNGGVDVPVGMVNLSVEGLYADTGRDGLALTTAKIGGTSFDNQTLAAASVYKRTDKWTFGGSIAGGDLGSIAFNHADTTSGALTKTIDNINEVEGSVFAQTNGDKWVGSARVTFGQISAGTTRHSASPSGYRNVSDEIDFAEVSFAGDFFVNDNAMMTFGFSYKDFSNRNDPVMSAGVGGEWKAKDSPIGIIGGVQFNRFGNQVQLGVVATFGGGTLADQVKKGPAAPVLTSLKQWTSLYLQGR